jgi:hypothetical protein
LSFFLTHWLGLPSYCSGPTRTRYHSPPRMQVTPFTLWPDFFASRKYTSFPTTKDVDLACCSLEIIQPSWRVLLSQNMRFLALGWKYFNSPARTKPGSALIPEVSIPYRYRIILVSITRINTVSIRYQYFITFIFHPLKIFFFNLLI